MTERLPATHRIVFGWVALVEILAAARFFGII